MVKSDAAKERRSAILLQTQRRAKDGV
jgi:hypothetical protein